MMRLTLGYLLLLAGCSADTSPANATPDSGAAGTEASNGAAANAAQPARPSGMDRAAFLAQCRRETLRTNPEAGSWVDETCRGQWSGAQAMLPLADALLRLAPRPGAPAPSLAAVRAALPVRWNPRPVYTGALADGAISGRAFSDSEAYVVLKGRPDAVGLVEFSGAVGPDGEGNTVGSLPDALVVRGARSSTVGCAGLQTVMRVDADGFAPFILATESSHGSGGGTATVRVFFTDAIPDLAALRTGRWPGAAEYEGAQWMPTCETQ